MYVKGDTWRVYDLIIDDISTVEDYRATLNKEIQEGGFASLMQKMRDRRDGKTTGPDMEGNIEPARKKKGGK